MKRTISFHGLTPRGNHARIYTIWAKIIQRCNNPHCKEFRFYGDKGIKISDKWLQFTGFLEDMGQSYKEHCKKFGIKQTTIDRIDTYSGYSKENCRWATKSEQASNMRSNIFYEINGERKHQAEWARTYHLDPRILNSRLKAGWNLMRALTEKSFIGKNQTFNR